MIFTEEKTDRVQMILDRIDTRLSEETHKRLDPIRRELIRQEIEQELSVV